MKSSDSLTNVTNDALSVAEGINTAANALGQPVSNLVSRYYAGRVWDAIRKGCPSVLDKYYRKELIMLAGVCLALASSLKGGEVNNADK